MGTGRSVEIDHRGTVGVDIDPHLHQPTVVAGGAAVPGAGTESAQDRLDQIAPAFLATGLDTMDAFGAVGKGECAQCAGAVPVGGTLRIEVGDIVGERAGGPRGAGQERVQGVVVERRGRQDHPFLDECGGRRRHGPGAGPADFGVVGTGRHPAEQDSVGVVDRRDHGDVG